LPASANSVGFLVSFASLKKLKIHHDYCSKFKN